MKIKNLKQNFVILILFLVFLTHAASYWFSQNNNLISRSQQQYNLKLNNNEIVIISPEENMYSMPMIGYFPATYGFESDEDGYFPRGWINDSLGVTSEVKVESEKVGHKKVLCYNDPSSSAGTFARTITNLSTPQVVGSIEYYIYKESGNGGFEIALRNSSGGYAIRIGIDYLNDGKFMCRTSDSIVFEFAAGKYLDNTWFHLRIDFNLSTKKFDIYLDGIKEVDQENMIYDVNSIQNVWFFQTGSGSTGQWYLDAIGFSWDVKYNLGDNLNEGLLLSFKNSTQLDWIGYSLDTQNNVTIAGNTTITFPDKGIHIVQVFGNDSIGTKFQSEKRYFVIYYPEEPEKPIKIDETIPIKNWTSSTSFYDWCSGSGTINDPYFIEGISIDGGGSDIGILIENTYKYFEIRNCTIYNAIIGIKTQNASNAKIYNNTIYSINGLDGVSPGSNGNDGVGISILNCLNVNISFNEISEISGGNGIQGGTNNNGGSGGAALGIKIESSETCIIYNNNITNILGGLGMDGGNGINDYPPGNGGNGGNGGFASGIYFKNTYNQIAEKNIIIDINGGQSGKGGAGGSVDYENGGFGGNGGIGGNVIGISFENSTYLITLGNNITNLFSGNGNSGGYGGKGGNMDLVMGEDGGIGGNGGNGGSGGLSLGIYFSESEKISNHQNRLSSINSGNGGNGGDGGNGGNGGPVDLSFNAGQGGDGGDGGDAGQGGFCSGLIFESINYADNDQNIVSNLIAGNGGNGGDGGNGGNGGTGLTGPDYGGYGGNGGNGGDGGIISAFLVDSSNMTTNNGNNISFNFGGLRGIGGDYGDPGIATPPGISSMQGLDGQNGSSYGFLLQNNHNNTILGNIFKNNTFGVVIEGNSSINQVFDNTFIDNELNARDDGSNNKWDNGTIGNSWDDYEGFDFNGDNMGDTPYNISGSAKSIDNHPIGGWKYPLPFIDVVVINQIFSIDWFNVTFYISNSLNEGIQFATIQIWWNGIDVTTDIRDIGEGFYNISLKPIIVNPGEEPILLNMTILADGYQEGYLEIYIAVDPDVIDKESEYNGKPSDVLPMVSIIIIIASTAGGLGLAGIGLFKYLKKRKKTNVMRYSVFKP